MNRPKPRVLRVPTVVASGDSRAQWDAQVRMFAGYLLEHLQTPQPVDAIIAASDAEVPIVAAACRLLGRIPNQDVAMAGYDNSWADYETTQWEPAPPLVTVDKNNRVVGAELIKLLQERVAGNCRPSHKNV
jgi:DNA-binding LacI/PurR family transcriptional regulator